MKAIVTKYVRPTSTRGSRIRAGDQDGNAVIMPYRSELSDYECHKQAAVALCEKMGWIGTLHGGHTKHSMVWVFHDEGLMVTLTRKHAGPSK